MRCVVGQDNLTGQQRATTVYVLSSRCCFRVSCILSQRTYINAKHIAAHVCFCHKARGHITDYTLYGRLIMRSLQGKYASSITALQSAQYWQLHRGRLAGSHHYMLVLHAVSLRKRTDYADTHLSVTWLHKAGQQLSLL
jgi:hypothetical protein